MSRKRKHAKGLQAGIHDLTLRDGKELAIEVGGVELPTPALSRDMEASSSLSVPIFDPGLTVLERTLLSQKFDVHVDGLRFRYIGASKSGPTVTLNFEDEVVARLRESTGPKSAYRAKQTRANFICHLVEELKPEVPIYCPQRHEKQPVEKKIPQDKRQSKNAAKEAKELGAKGIGDTKGLKVKGQPATPEQQEHAEMALRIAGGLRAPFRVQVALMAALIVETLIGTYGPGMSNILEAEGTGVGAEKANAETQIKNFLTGSGGYGRGGAIGYYKENPDATFYEIAQALQGSGAGNSTNGAGNYGQVGDEARQFVEAMGGGTEAELTSGSETVVEPYTFKVGRGETYWAAIQRLAKEVNWRAFVVSGRFFFISEVELSRGQVQLAIQREKGRRTPKTQGIIDVDFDYNVNKVTAEATVTAMAEHWNVRPGGVVTLEGYGPASIGAGDAPPEKGATIGLSSAVKAGTHEGRGRYLVSSIDVDLDGDPKAREATITLVKPTRPLPEKATSTTTRSSGSGALTSEGVPEKAAEIINAIEIVDAAHPSYDWAGGHTTFARLGADVDCSGFVSQAVHAAGFLTHPLTSAEFARVFPAGEGEWVTIYGDGEHVVMKVKFPDGHWRGAATSGSNPGGGPGWVPDSYLEMEEKLRGNPCHPPGL